ncbi:uncharacterized protein AB675_9410 [Cyphellophora attinorum]|uniref:TM7S3/TM198-like domain-containing protein n=1 Tax=Cyphellophora attinorum TaxID=1664694 RepID=A0A0N1P216_9EURO|nr:uncharacterized protein AB675_9410 [Phialophora attinorum]KPI41607.1 hypothetical protein AB675_9410 [Phialophora attinorum]
MDAKDPRPYQAIGIDMASSESGRERFVKDGIYTPPPTSSWRCNLTALSQRYNLYFVASRSGVAVYTPSFPFQTLGRKPKLYIPPALAEPHARGYIDPGDPHAINHLVVGDLGTEEILLVATDSGNVTGYHTKAIYEAVRNDPYRFSNEARSDVAGLRPFFTQCVHESAWGLAIHSSARLIAVSANVPRQQRQTMSEGFATITIFAFALSGDGYADRSAEAVPTDQCESDEADWRDWDPKSSSPMPRRRNHNYKIVLAGPNGHRSNIPSISFVNSSQDLQGQWLLSTDISGYLKMWQLWPATCARTWHFGVEEIFGYQPLDDEAGWLVAALDPASFHPARSMAQFCGHKSAPPIDDARESYDITSIVRLTVPGRSHRHPFLETGSADSSDSSSMDSSDDEGDVVADHWSDDDSSQGERPNDTTTVPDGERANGDLHSRSIAPEPVMTSEQPSADVSRDIEDIFLDRYDDDVEDTEDDIEDDSETGDLDSPEAEEDGSEANDERSTSPVSFASETSLSHVTQRSSVEVEIAPLTIASPRSRASPAGSNEAVKAKKRTRDSRQSRDREFRGPGVPTIHCTTNNMRLLNAPQQSGAHIFCAGMLEQRLPQSRIWRGQGSSMRRLNMVQQIPDLGIVIIASQFGRCAICALTRHPNTRTYGLRVDWIVPTKRQEKSGERPGVWLLGIATAPIQGQELEDEHRQTSGDGWDDATSSDDAKITFDPRIVALPDRDQGLDDHSDDDNGEDIAQKRRRRSSPEAEDSGSGSDALRIRQDNVQSTDVASIAPSVSASLTVSDAGRPTTGPTLGQEDNSSAGVSSTSSVTSSAEAGRSSTVISTTFITSPSPTSNATDSSSATGAPAATTQINLQPSTTDQSEPIALPLQPAITPAFGIAGAILILTGVAYTLIGIKHRFLQVFLSNGFLAALSVTVLIDYVMKPPISLAVQGAYFVAIFMTGCLYGGGSLIFKEVTEGFGCLLGGFCLSMWFLCLKPGGLITEQTGKAILIGVFSVAVWSLSFSRYTREYGLIGSTSFAGATAFVLGIDCFSRAGLKEFWFYIWELNDNLFPLNTNTYPITRGMIVELIVIVLVTIIGVLSQIKLWRIVRARRDRRNAIKLDDERRRDVVEEAIGRHLERQNEKDRPKWEMQFGNNLAAKRSTILWTDAHPDKGITHITPVEDKRMSSVESVELTAAPGPYRVRSKVSARNLKRQSTATVDVIPEETEEEFPEKTTSKERLKALSALDANAPIGGTASTESFTPQETTSTEAAGSPEPPVEDSSAKTDVPEIVPLPFKIPTIEKPESRTAKSSKSAQPQSAQRLSVPKEAQSSSSKRKSIASMFSVSSRLSYASDQATPSASVEQLVLPSPRSSRASSLAATLDEEDRMSIFAKYGKRNSYMDAEPVPPILAEFAARNVSSVDVPSTIETKVPEVPPSPSADSVEVEDDPEALFRPVSRSQGGSKPEGTPTVSDSTPRQGSNSSEARYTTEHSSVADGLTPGALESIPKQTSHVVMAYRTNEWAKHIAEADEPIYIEPEQLPVEVEEPAVQLAPVPTVDRTRTLQASTTPPPPHVAAVSQNGIVAVVSEATRAHNQAKEAPVSNAPAAITRPQLQGKRSSTFLSNKKTLITEPIDENAVTEFASSLNAHSSMQRPMSPPAGPQRIVRTASLPFVPPAALQPSRSATSLGLAHPYQLNRSNTSSTNIAAAYQNTPVTRSSSSLGHYAAPAHSSSNPHVSRSSSFMSGLTIPAMRSETRLDSYDSHQPKGSRDDAAERMRRENLLAEWRSSQGVANGGLVAQIQTKESVEHRRAQMLLDREHRRLLEERMEFNKNQAQLVMDQGMRTPVMMDAHRSMMRRMQAGVKTG